MQLLPVLIRKQGPEETLIEASHLGLCVLLTKSLCNQSGTILRKKNRLIKRQVPGFSLWPSAVCKRLYNRAFGHRVGVNNG